MSVLVAGLVLFLGVHLVPVVPSLRARMMARWGERSYRGRFSVISAIGLVLIVLGAMHFFNLYVFSQLRRRRLSTTPSHIEENASPTSTCAIC